MFVGACNDISMYIAVLSWHNKQYTWRAMLQLARLICNHMYNTLPLIKTHSRLFFKCLSLINLKCNKCLCG